MQRLLALDQVCNGDIGVHQLSANTQVDGAAIVITELCTVLSNPGHVDGAPLLRRENENVIEILGSISARLAHESRWKEDHQNSDSIDYQNS